MTSHLADLRQKPFAAWDTMSLAEQTRLFDTLYEINPKGGMTALGAWDINALAWNKEKLHSPVSSPQARGTVSVKGRVYFSHEVNYILWGLISRFGYDSGIRTAFSSRGGVAISVFYYRMTAYIAGELPRSAGRIRWAETGWDWG